MTLRNFLLYDNFFLITALPATEVYRRILILTDPAKYKELHPDNPYQRQFEGEVTPTHFRISEVRFGRESYKQVISGEIIQLNEHTRIDVRIRMHKWNRNYMVVVLTLLGTITIFNAISIFRKASENINSLDGFEALPFIFLVFFYILRFAIFQSEASKAKSILMRIFEAHYVEK